jgi:ATP-dependent Clp protease ATP-binding subunit ClpB
VILFDEIEKAHSDVFNVLLQILEDGRLTDGKGRTVDFKNTVVIMTSNVGSSWIQELGAKDKSEIENRVEEALRATFKPEFLNRIDDIIVFNSLGRAEISRIVDIQLMRLQKLLAEKKVSLELTGQARELLFKEGYDPVYGARPLRRAIQQLIQDKLALKMLDGEILPGDHVIADADVDRGELVFDKAASSKQTVN